MTPSGYAGLGETRRNLFRLLLIGYFEGIDSERGIAWRAADSFALRDCSRCQPGRRARSLDDFADALLISVVPVSSVFNKPLTGLCDLGELCV
jgi:hypothetical protein